MTEFNTLRDMLALFRSESPELIVANGDDAAVLALADRHVVLSVDAQVEGVHFRPEWLSMRQLGYRATMAAFSDLAAMGAKPVALLSSVQFDAGSGRDELLELAHGQQQACMELGAIVIGGNLSRAATFAVHSTVVGTVNGRTLARAGAKAGDKIGVAGSLGMAARGLEALMLQREDPKGIAAWMQPTAQISAGLAAASLGASAAIDISDGLAQDLGHMADASRVSIRLDETALAPFVRAAGSLERVLQGGEDYALVVAASVLPEGFVHIGDVDEGKGVILGGRPLPPRGWQHL